MKTKAGKTKKTQVRIKDMKPKKSVKGGNTIGIARGLSANTVGGVRGLSAISNPSKIS